MRAMAQRLQEDEYLWGVVGLLHDLDYDYTQGNPEKHANFSAEILKGLLPDEGVNAIKAHNYLHTDYLPSTRLDKSLIAADAVSGLIIASALVMPHKKISEVTPDTVLKKFHDKSFAKGCNRNKIQLCVDVGIPLGEFLDLSLDALKGIAEDLGL